MIQPIIGVIILFIIVYVSLKVFKNLIFGVVMIGLVLFASFLIFGSLPDLKSVPLIGQFLPTLPGTTGEAIAIIKNVFYSIDILSVDRDSQNYLLITVINTGRLSVSDFRVLVDGQPTDILNKPTDPLTSGQGTTIQANWKKEFTKVEIITDRASASYS